MTVCCVRFVATWLVALGARLGFIALAEHDDAFRAHLGEFIMTHQIHASATAPFFVIWALAMVTARIRHPGPRPAAPGCGSGRDRRASVAVAA